MKIAIIGCTHAGTAAAINSAKLYKNAEITVYERNDNISFLSCGIALHVEGVVKDPQGLFYSSPKQLSSLGINTKMRHNVKKVNFKEKKLLIENLETGEIFENEYDKLIITTGSWPIMPDIEGINMDNILLSKNFYHAQNIISKIENVKKVVVVGAGYIGVELVEAFRKQGKNVTLIDIEDRILSKYLDKEFTDIAEEALKENGVKLALGEKVVKFEGENNKVKKVITTKSEHEADLVILSIGFKPNTDLFKNKLKMLDNGAIIVDEYMRASEKDVYAAGDCCAVYYNPLKEYEYIPLATNAIRMGTIAAYNLKEKRLKHLGTQGTSGIKIYGNNIAATGLTETVAKSKGIDVESILITENHRPEFMPTFENLKFKVVYEKKNGIILGAQIISKADLTQSINTMSVIIQNKMKMEELAFVDFFFQPHFNKPWNFLNIAGLEYINKK
ncbi:NADPH-dependent 2,4-dienoyl-CoA reductase, sulfur reductase [Marinitoga hydrogenitolerans DSM 16785]|uniref:NADPH-dependent 2,4-dienoyl-CoA reductase, sulfur reductase n=1 Tax=Marinitoga hydrogenitolerans (strain DSM 16785 / JCM 12826 / AT1271) TaxID=1122195 RepID=A0A1M4ZA06_MARH1|nr:FAD-dependent oxidoreductase [Marinitoga hydrogenitolerans]SHF14893.1 NADPH-dependent 2,4-dienoyl-CoA reductase, sulfur reductase [Marinitoga hydrogenitolerans DSM 16785]